MPAFLADYAYFVRGLLELERAQRATDSGGPGEAQDWLGAAVRLTEEQFSRLGDSAGGFFAAAEAPDVLVRSKDFFDGAAPSANAVAVLNLLDLVELTRDQRWRAEAEKSMRSFAPLLERLAEPARLMTLAARRMGSNPEGPAKAVSEAPRATRESLADREARRKVELRLGVGAAEADGTSSFALTLMIAPGWHIYAPDPEGEMPAWVRPLRVKGLGVEILDFCLPNADELPRLPAPATEAEGSNAERLRIYEGEIRIEGHLAHGPEPGAKLQVTFQPCDDMRCLPIVEELVEVAKPS